MPIFLHVFCEWAVRPQGGSTTLWGFTPWGFERLPTRGAGRGGGAAARAVGATGAGRGSAEDPKNVPKAIEGTVVETRKKSRTKILNARGRLLARFQVHSVPAVHRGSWRP